MLRGAIVKDFIDYCGGVGVDKAGKVQPVTEAFYVDVEHMIDWDMGCSTCGYRLNSVDLMFFNRQHKYLGEIRGIDLTDFF